MLAAFLTALILLMQPAAAADYFVYTGSFTNRNSKGIYAYRFQGSSDQLSPLGLAAESINPAFLAEHPTHRFLYAVNNSPGQPENTVSAFAIDSKSGKLALLNKIPSRGQGPSHLGVDHSGRWLAVANYASGSVALLPVHADGKLSEAVAFHQHVDSSPPPSGPRQPHAHMVLFSPDNRFLLVADLGLDRIYSYRFDAAQGSLSANDPAFVTLEAGAGPRHLVLHPNGKTVYSVNERNSTATVLDYDPSSGRLSALQTVSTLPAGFTGRNSGAEIVISRNARFLYTSNRGHDSIAVFSIDPVKRTITLKYNIPTDGRTPRNFNFDPTENYVVAGNEASDSLVVFAVDGKTGGLARKQILNDAPTPTCIIFVPAGGR
jgi:6-phosphogluconolactonase